jgi:hypothetical protein
MTDAELAAFLAQEAGRLLLIEQHSGLYADKALGEEGDAAANDLLCGCIRARGPMTVLSEEEKDNPARLSPKPRVDHRSGRRHPRIWRRAQRLGGACGAGGRWRGASRCGRPAGAGAGAALRPAIWVPAPMARLRMVVSRSARRPKPWRWQGHSAAKWCRWAAPGPRPWPWCGARPTSISIPAGSMNGTAARRWPWHSHMACIARGSTAAR